VMGFFEINSKHTRGVVIRPPDSQCGPRWTESLGTRTDEPMVFGSMAWFQLWAVWAAPTLWQGRWGQVTSGWQPLLHVSSVQQNIKQVTNVSHCIIFEVKVNR
jgi:hypothetical protein